MTRQSLWQRMGAWLRGQPSAGGGGDPVLVPPPPLRREAEIWLQELAHAQTDRERRDAVGGREFWTHIEQLWHDGYERQAIDWVTKFIVSPATDASVMASLRARLAEFMYQHGDLDDAVPHLQELLHSDDHATRAHYLLAEHYRRRGDEVQALRHYEAVLARDMAYPNVRERVERLRLARGRITPAALGATVAGGDLQSATAGARYMLVRELGRGSTGVVYLARDKELDRDVAVKLLHPHLAAAHRAEACAQFFEEARISASLRHPNIVAVLDMDEEARRIVMELAAGGTLRTVLRERGPRTVRRALERHTQLLSALVAAHRQGIIHRDIKPGNLMPNRPAGAHPRGQHPETTAGWR